MALARRFSGDRVGRTKASLFGARIIGAPEEPEREALTLIAVVDYYDLSGAPAKAHNRLSCWFQCARPLRANGRSG